MDRTTKRNKIPPPYPQSVPRAIAILARGPMFLGAALIALTACGCCTGYGLAATSVQTYGQKIAAEYRDMLQAGMLPPSAQAEVDAAPPELQDAARSVQVGNRLESLRVYERALGKLTLGATGGSEVVVPEVAVP